MPSSAISGHCMLSETNRFKIQVKKNQGHLQPRSQSLSIPGKPRECSVEMKYSIFRKSELICLFTGLYLVNESLHLLKCLKMKHKD